jgi:hypothetical protein
MWVSPGPGKKVAAQVIFGHPASGNITTFLHEARELALVGVQSFLVDFGFDKNNADPGNLKNPDREIEFRKKCISLIERATLALSPDLPVTYVGKNFGAFIGGIAASQENRISRFVLIAGLPDLTDFYVSSDHTVALNARGRISDEQLEYYRERTHFWNPAQRMPRSKRTKKTDIFFQFGSKDDWIPEETARRYIQSAIPSAQLKKQSKFYPDGHDMNHYQAKLDRKKFILQDASFSDTLKAREGREANFL